MTLEELHEQEGVWACEGMSEDDSRYGCLYGVIYGPCGSSSCTGVCNDNYGYCPCRCHKEDTEVTT